jgi:NADH-quinone oxidoreductase subunit K
MTLHACLLLAAALFALGVFAVLTRRNAIALLVGVELMVNSALIVFVAFARFTATDASAGTTFTLFAVAATACEMAVALALVMGLKRQRKSLDLTTLEGMRG